MSAEMYPERRPYATTLPHSGYLAKPFLPPVEALRILNSTIGLDMPRALRRDRLLSDVAVPGSRSAMTPRPPTRPTAVAAAGERLSDNGMDIQLAMPFAFKEKDYHTSQQTMLNAQLNDAVEKLIKAWNLKMRDLMEHLRTYPPQGAASFSLSSDSMMSYFDGYRAADVPPLPAEDLVQDFKLGSTPAMLDGIQRSPNIPIERVRRALDAMLNSNHFLAPLEHYVKELEGIAAIALPDEPRESIEGGNGALRGPVSLNKAAVALHEKFHYDPSEYALRELRKSDAPIEQLERRVLEAKGAKEKAIDESLPGEALEYLTAQVDFSNDLLLMNKARMELVRLHSRDVKELRPLVETVIADARRSAFLLKGRTERDMPIVQKDIDRVRQDSENTTEHINFLQSQNRDANLNARREYTIIDEKERDLWRQLLEIMQKIKGVAEEKDNFVHRELLLRQQRARDEAIATELLNSQLAYYERLRAAEELLWRWSTAAQVFDAYVEAFAPKLIKKVHDAEEADRDLQIRESQEYVRRYDMFEFAVEEARATRQVYVDRIARLQRSKTLDVERALGTLDPNREKYDRELVNTQTQLEEAQAYMELVGDLERERRAEVEPIVQFVISFNRTMQSRLSEMEATADLRLRDSTPLGRATPSTVAAESFLARGADGAALVEAEDEREAMAEAMAEAKQKSTDSRGAMAAVTDTVTSTKSDALWSKSMDTRATQMLATVAHPHVQARTIGIEHEGLFFTKIKKFADDEQTAVEAAAGKMRQTRNDVERLGIKYDNADYVRMTIGDSRNVTF